MAKKFEPAIDSPEEIAQCLNCERPRCTDCFREGGRKMQRVPVEKREMQRVPVGEKGFTPYELSFLSGISVPTIYAIERGQTVNPTLGTLQRLLYPLGKVLCVGDLDEVCT